MKDTRTATIRFRLLKLSDNKIVKPLPPMVPPDRLDHQPGWSAWTGATPAPAAPLPIRMTDPSPLATSQSGRPHRLRPPVR